ncbi:MAG: HPr family phosphocarrier protein [Phycisphaerales bacterium]|nr:HPr family phosphocarrier protein [Phycisphaerales bacterium]
MEAGMAVRRKAAAGAEGAAMRRDGGDRMGSAVVREVTVVNAEGMHARPVMKFVDLAMRFQAEVTVRNVSRRGEELDGKSAMNLMLLDAPRGCVLAIRAEGEDADQAADALAALIADGFLGGDSATAAR